MSDPLLARTGWCWHWDWALGSWGVAVTCCIDETARPLIQPTCCSSTQPTLLHLHHHHCTAPYFCTAALPETPRRPPLPSSPDDPTFVAAAAAHRRDRDREPDRDRDPDQEDWTGADRRPEHSATRNSLSPEPALLPCRLAPAPRRFLPTARLPARTLALAPALAPATADLAPARALWRTLHHLPSATIPRK
ncbi:hypothetical protein DM02DRAFT_661140 [Periconia macrospinosa]|uniref:Uncharacterized protein n=1 Tax=Periconia macrospinosa TaxID=97972 RepID=A0A2V1D894_9PLEO|nr:hypothetical protein DM02DRAFT_661140 [Periconia macrospinosa]